MTLQIFSAYASDSDPPNTVKSCEKTNTSRPSIEAVSGDHAVAEEVLLVEPELRRPMGDECVELDKRTRVEEQVESLARGQLSPGMLPLDPDGAAAKQRLLAHLPQPIDACLARWSQVLPGVSATRVFAQGQLEAPLGPYQ